MPDQNTQYAERMIRFEKERLERLIKEVRKTADALEKYKDFHGERISQDRFEKLHDLIKVRIYPFIAWERKFLKCAKKEKYILRDITNDDILEEINLLQDS